MHNDLKIKDNVVSYDTETTGVRPYGDYDRWGYHPSRPFAFSFYDTEGNSAFFRLEVDPFTRRVIPDKRIKREVGAILKNRKIRKVGQNLGFDIRMSEMSDMKFNGDIDDTLFMAKIVTGGSEINYGLKEMGVKYLDVSNDDEKELGDATKKARTKAKKLGWLIATKEEFGDQAYKADYWLAPLKLLERYAVCDAERTMLFWLLWKEELDATPNLAKIYEMEMKLFWLTKKMEELGPRVFPKRLDELREYYEGYKKKWLKVANANGGKGMNFRSGKQKIKKFIIDRGHKPLKWGDEIKKPHYTELDRHRNPKVDGTFIKSIAMKGDKLAKAILEYETGNHAIKGFLDPYDKFRIFENGVWVVHPNYKQMGCVTVRYSCGDPNLMQVAAPDGGGKKADVILRPREAFGPRPGHIWYLADYSQIEVWLFAYCSGEEAMIKALHSGHDFHGSIAFKVWGHLPDYKKNKSFYRKRGKLLMFCKVYGGGAGAVADLLGCSKEEARGFIQEYDDSMPGVRRFMKRMVNKIERDGMFNNPFGRTFCIDSRFSYKSVNYMIQGTAADILKQAMLNVDALLQRRWKGCHILLTIHDELVIEIPKKYHSKRLMREIINAMQSNFHTYVGCPVPLPVSIKYATRRWSDAKKIEL